MGVGSKCLKPGHAFFSGVMTIGLLYYVAIEVIHLLCLGLLHCRGVSLQTEIIARNTSLQIHSNQRNCALRAQLTRILVMQKPIISSTGRVPGISKAW